jgi:CheY-like chemotaxis protein
MPKGGTIEFATQDEEKDGTSFVKLQVSDTGAGIPQEVQSQIFDPFFSTKGSLGTGLGLSITYGIVTRYGGSISVDSTVGRGTTFVIRLPADKTEAEPAGPNEQDSPFIPCSILVVEDEPEIREVLMDGLTEAGYKITIASGGKEAISLLNLVQYDVLITDLGMPEVNGWDVLQAARTQRPGMILGIVTGWGETLDPAQLKDRGVSLLVSKPFEMKRLIHEIRAAVARKYRQAA